MEGCYIPFDWRNDFDEQYLASIRFICLAMTDKYIETHFDEIKGHSSDIESRLNDDACTIDNLKEDNRKCVEGFQRDREQVVLIDDDYNKAIGALIGC